MDLLLLPFLWTKREGENGILLGKGEEASCCGGSAVCAAVQWIAKGWSLAQPSTCCCDDLMEHAPPPPPPHTHTNP
jgi:hypothetical protein